MKYRIVVDSSANLLEDYIIDSNVSFKVCPLSVVVGEKEFIDDETCKVTEMLDAVHSYKGKSSSSCPPIGLYYENMNCDADMVFVVTLTSKLSGSYNAACSARNMILDEDPNRKIHVIDSKSVCGTEELIIDELYRLMKENKGFEEIIDAINDFIPKKKLFFIIQSFESLIKNGRIPKIVGTLASVLALKPICCDDGNGEIKITTKVRGTKSAVAKMADMIKNFANDLKDRTLIISHCQSQEIADYALSEINKVCEFKEIRIREMRGLCSYYALEKGLILCI